VNIHAGVVKLVDALDSKSSGATRAGSIPAFGTINKNKGLGSKGLIPFFVIAHLLHTLVFLGNVQQPVMAINGVQRRAMVSWRLNDKPPRIALRGLFCMVLGSSLFIS
jgi:hypothetical protein